MKIIDLLNKIANGEEVPRKIEYRNRILYLEDEAEEYEPTFNYYDIDGENSLFTGWIGQYLNDEVEILEEEKKIPEKLDHLIGYDIQQFDDLKEYVEIVTNDLFGKVNKIIDTLNQLSDYLKSKGE